MTKLHDKTYESKRDDWQTPPFIINAILQAVKQEKFDVDMATDTQFNVPAIHHCTKSGTYRNGLLIDERDGLNFYTEGLWFLNPPFKQSPIFCKRIMEIMNTCTVVALFPVRTETVYWHDKILRKADCIYFVQGKVDFYYKGNPVGGAGMPSPIALVFYNLSPQMNILERDLNETLKGTLVNSYGGNI